MRSPHRLLRPFQTVLALVLGAMVGIWLGRTPSPGLPALLAERVSQMAARVSLAWLSALAVPLIFSGAVLGGVGLEAMRGMPRLACKSLAWMAGSTALAVCLGVIVVALAKPDFFLLAAWSNSVPAQGLPEPRESGSVWLGLVLLSLAFGFYRNQLEEGHGKLVMRFCQALHGMLTPLLRASRRFAPLGVFFLVVAATVPGVRWSIGLTAYSHLRQSSTVGWDVLLVLIAAAAFVLLVSGLLWLLIRVNVWRHAGFLLPAMSVAAAGQTLLGALPLTMDAAQRHLGVSSRVASVTLPLGAAWSREGLALGWTVAALSFWGPPHGQSGQVSLLSALLAGWFVGCGLAAFSAGSELLLPLMITSNQEVSSFLMILTVCSVGSAVSVFSQICVTILVARSEGEYWVPGPPPDPDELQGLKTDLELAEG